MSDAIIRTVTEIQLFDDFGITVCFVRNDCHRLIASNALTGLAHKCPCSIGVSPRRQPEINELSTLVHRSPKVIRRPFTRTWVSSLT